MKKSEAIAYRKSIEQAASMQTDEQALENISLYPAWIEGIPVVKDGRYRYGDKLYKCVQAHTTQGDWAPGKTPALWTEVSVESWPEWKQPTGAQDAYQQGDKVSHNSKHWVSDVNANIWEPGVYGWSEA